MSMPFGLDKYRYREKKAKPQYHNETKNAETYSGKL